jgi:hypothetical protein
VRGEGAAQTPIYIYEWRRPNYVKWAFGRRPEDRSASMYGDDV